MPIFFSNANILLACQIYVLISLCPLPSIHIAQPCIKPSPHLAQITENSILISTSFHFLPISVLHRFQNILFKMETCVWKQT